MPASGEKASEFVVDTAVSREPVSNNQFPANREKYREIREKGDPPARQRFN
jgi:hypothetical protein